MDLGGARALTLEDDVVHAEPLSMSAVAMWSEPPSRCCAPRRRSASARRAWSNRRRDLHEAEPPHCARARVALGVEQEDDCRACVRQALGFRYMSATCSGRRRREGRGDDSPFTERCMSVTPQGARRMRSTRASLKGVLRHGVGDSRANRYRCGRETIRPRGLPQRVTGR